MDYDTYLSRPSIEQNRTWPDLTPANKAEIVATHLRRYLEANRDRLSAEQVAFLEEQLEFARPEIYEHPPTEELSKINGDRERRLLALFPRDEAGKIHFRAFLNGLRWQRMNSVARFLHGRIEVEDSEVEGLRSVLDELRRLPVDEIRLRHADLPEILERNFRFPEAPLPRGADFWRLIDDEVRESAWRAWSRLLRRS